MLYVATGSIKSSVALFVRSNGNVRLYAVDGIFTTVMNILFNLIFLLGFNMGNIGYLLSVICADACSIVFLSYMGKVHRYMGLSVGLIVPGMDPKERRASYAADITYCTNNELGFDYLRDNMAIYKQELVQRGHAFAIVDEVDSILIDEARTPLIISGKGEDSSKLYEMADYFVSTLRKQVFAKTDEKEVQDHYDCDYFVDEKSRTVSLTAEGIAKAEKKASRIAAEGIVACYIDGNTGVLVELNCESDFVAKNPQFSEIATEVSKVIVKYSPANVEALLACETAANGTVSTLINIIKTLSNEPDAIDALSEFLKDE